MASGPVRFDISRLESYLRTTMVENCGTAMTAVGTGRVGADLSSFSWKIDEKDSFSNSAWADGVNGFLAVPISPHVGVEQFWLSFGLESKLLFVFPPEFFHQFWKFIWFFAIHLECISRWVALALDELFGHVCVLLWAILTSKMFIHVCSAEVKSTSRIFIGVWSECCFFINDVIRPTHQNKWRTRYGEKSI